MSPRVGWSTVHFHIILRQLLVACDPKLGGFLGYNKYYYHIFKIDKCIRFKTVSYPESYPLTQLRNASHNNMSVCPTITGREVLLPFEMVS